MIRIINWLFRKTSYISLEELKLSVAKPKIILEDEDFFRHSLRIVDIA